MKKGIIGLDISMNSTGMVAKLQPENENDPIKYRFYVIVPEDMQKKKVSKNIVQVPYKRVYPPEDKTYTQDDNAKHISAYNQFLAIRDIIKTFIKETGIEKVDIHVEGGLFVAGKGAGQNTINLCIFNSIIKLQLMGTDFVDTVRVFAPSQVKKIWTGKGNAKKDAMIDKFMVLYPETTFDYVGKIDDAIDAYVLAYCSESDEKPIPPKKVKKRKPKVPKEPKAPAIKKDTKKK